MWLQAWGLNSIQDCSKVPTTMSQDRLIKLVTKGDEKGLGKGHVIYTTKNKKKVERKIELKKYNPVARKRTVYKEAKK